MPEDDTPEILKDTGDGTPEILKDTGGGVPEDETSADDTPEILKDTGDGTPEKEIEYTDFEVPEGFQVSEEILDDFKGTARELKLSQENAQKLISLHSSVVQKQREQDLKLVEETQTHWLQELKKSKSLTEGDFNKNLRTAGKALTAHFNEEAVGFLKQTGLLNNPSIVEGLFNIGKQIAEAELVMGERRARVKSKETTLAELFKGQ